MDNILLIGAGGHAKSCIDVIESDKKFNIIGLIDKEINKTFFNYSILGNDDDLLNLKSKSSFAFVTMGQIGYNSTRSNLFNLIKEIGFKIPTIISPFSYISKHSFVDIGSIIMHGAIINSNVKIGYNTIINSKALIEHDCNISNNCHISTGAIINGGVTISKNTFIGSGAIIRNGINIPENSFIKAGSLISQ